FKITAVGLAGLEELDGDLNAPRSDAGDQALEAHLGEPLGVANEESPIGAVEFTELDARGPLLGIRPLAVGWIGRRGRPLVTLPPRGGIVVSKRHRRTSRERRTAGQIARAHRSARALYRPRQPRWPPSDPTACCPPLTKVEGRDLSSVVGKNKEFSK